MTKKKAHEKKVAKKQLDWPGNDEIDVPPPRSTITWVNGGTITYRNGTIAIDPGMWTALPAGKCTIVPAPNPVHDPFYLGRDAGTCRQPLSTNPYDFGTDEHRSWTDGWTAGRQAQMSPIAFAGRNYERRLAAPKRPTVDRDVQELLDDNVHALRYDIYEEEKEDDPLLSLQDSDTIYFADWREDEEDEEII